MDAVIMEEDTFLVMSTDVDLVLSDEHPVRVINKARAIDPEPLGSVVIRSGRPLVMLAIVHDLGADPICTEGAVRAALDQIVAITESRQLRRIALPMLGVLHGGLEVERVLELTRSVMRTAKRVQDVWLLVEKRAEASVKRLLQD
jgi:hypothetical protein